MENQFLMKHPPLAEGDVRISQNNRLYQVFRLLAEEEAVPYTTDTALRRVIGEIDGH